MHKNLLVMHKRRVAAKCILGAETCVEITLQGWGGAGFKGTSRLGRTLADHFYRNTLDARSLGFPSAPRPFAGSPFWPLDFVLCALRAFEPRGYPSVIEEKEKQKDFLLQQFYKVRICRHIEIPWVRLVRVGIWVDWGCVGH